MCPAPARVRVTTNQNAWLKHCAGAYFQLYQSPVKVMRPFNVYGPGQPGVDAVLAASLPEVLAGADLPVLGTGWPELREANWADLSALMRTPALLDARNYLRDTPLPSSLRYCPVGRAVLA